MPRCFAPRRDGGPKARLKARSLTNQSTKDHLQSIICNVILPHIICSRLRERFVHVGPKGPWEVFGVPVKTPIHSPLHMIVSFCNNPELIHEFNVDKNGGKISKIRF